MKKILPFSVDRLESWLHKYLVFLPNNKKALSKRGLEILNQVLKEFNLKVTQND